MKKSRRQLLQEYQFAVSQVRLKRHELKCARLRAMEIARELRDTPLDIVFDGEVINDETPESEGGETPALLAPSSQPGQDIPRSD